MGETTGISWCHRTWSPWYGCTQVSMGEHGACVGCYARQMSEHRFHRVVFGGPGRGEGTRDVRADSAWAEPLRWNRTAPGSLIFPSMCDPFDNHRDLAEPRRRFFDLIRATPNLTWLLLTKRPGNIVKLYEDACLDSPQWLGEPWPANAAIGCTIVTQEEADRDIPKLLAAKAEVKPAFVFLSMEPLLGPVNLRPWLPGCYECATECGCRLAERPDTERCEECGEECGPDTHPRVSDGCPTCGGDLEAVCPDCGSRMVYQHPDTPCIDWVITGGETDQGAHRARPTHPDWLRSIRDQCAAAAIPYHHKQNGEWAPGETCLDLRARDCATLFDGVWDFDRVPAGASDDHIDDEPDVYRVGKNHSGRLLDGVLHDAMPKGATAQ